MPTTDEEIERLPDVERLRREIEEARGDERLVQQLEAALWLAEFRERRTAALSPAVRQLGGQLQRLRKTRDAIPPGTSLHEFTRLENEMKSVRLELDQAEIEDRQALARAAGSDFAQFFAQRNRNWLSEIIKQNETLVREILDQLDQQRVDAAPVPARGKRR